METERASSLTAAAPTAAGAPTIAPSDAAAPVARRPEGAAADPAAAAVNDPAYVIRFSCLDNSAYHAMRSAHYERIHRTIMAMILLFSSATLASLLRVPWLQPYTAVFSLVPLLASTLSVVIAPSNRAQTHASLRARYMDLLANVEEAPPTDENCRKWKAILHRISAQEPPVIFRVIQAVAYNTAVDHLFL